MTLTFFGHAAVGIVVSDFRIVIDPYRSPECGGYAPIDVTADLVICSHENDTYHSHLGQVRGEFQVVRGLELPPEGWADGGGLRIRALRVFETPERLPEDEVTVIVLEIGGKRIVHLGDLGHELSEVEVRELQGADCLLVPAGGPPTIEIDQIPALLDTLAPRLVIPVHYFIPGKIGLAIKPVDELVAKLTNWHVRRPGTSTIDFVDWAGLDRQCLILEPAR